MANYGVAITSINMKPQVQLKQTAIETGNK